MKKIFTLFIATVVAMSMMALPQNLNLAGKKSMPASKSQVEAKTPVQAKTLKNAELTKVQRELNTEAAKALPAFKGVAPKKMAAATQDADIVYLNFTNWAVAPEWYPESQDWFFSLDGDGYIVKFDYFGTEETYCGTYTTEDFDMNYSFMYTPTDMLSYEEVTMTVSEEKVSEYLTVSTVHAEILATDGVVYVVDMVANNYTPKSTIELTLDGATLTTSDENHVINGKNDELDLNVVLNWYWPGAFTYNQFDLEATKIVYNGVEQTLLDASIETTAQVLGKDSYAWVSELSYINQDTVLVNVHITSPMPKSTETVEITVNNLDIDASWAAWFGWVYLTGANSDYEIYAGYAGFDAEAGTYVGDETMLYVTDWAADTEYEALYAEVTLKESEESENGWVVEIEAYCTDFKNYKITMLYQVPEPTVTKVVSFETSSNADYYPDLGNDLMLYNANDEYDVALDVYGIEIGDSFTLDNMDAYYTYIYDGDEAVQIGRVNGVLTQNGDTTKMVASVIGFNGVQYDVTLWYCAPTPTETVELVVEGATFVNQMESNGAYQLYGSTADENYVVTFAMVTEEVEGTFVNDGKFGSFGDSKGAFDFLPSYTYVLEYTDPLTGDYEIYPVAKGSVTVTMGEDNSILLTGSVVCANAVQYNVTMTSTYEKAHLEYDEDAPLDYVYTTGDELYMEADEDYGLVYLELNAADHTNTTAIYFFVEEFDEEIMIPAGTYTISDSQDYGTVLASQGVTYDGVYPSFFGTTDEEGYLMQPIWFMVDGTVTVEKVNGQLYLEVNALNSYDQEIHIVYDGSANGGEGELYYDVITNMSFDLDNMVIYGGPSEQFGVEVVLGLAEDNMDGSFTLSPESQVTILNGQEVTFIDGIAYEIDAYAPSALVDLVVDWNGTILQFHLEMSATKAEAVVIEVYDANVEIGQVELFDGVYDYTLTMTANWTDADGVTYPVLVEVPVYYPEATEPYDMLATVTVGGWADEDPWLGFGEGYVTVSTVDDVVTVQGLIENPGTGFAADITIAGKLEATALENVTTATFDKVLKNGQLIIIKNGVEYNAQGAIVK